jgi:hypothetical protein
MASKIKNLETEEEVEVEVEVEVFSLLDYINGRTTAKIDSTTRT